MAGCHETVVVIGARAPRVGAVLPDHVQRVTNADHPAGMGSSLAVGLTHLLRSTADVALVMLVDLPDVTRDAVDRVVRRACASVAPQTMLARAAYAGRPGHPVVIGRSHFTGVIAAAVGDVGARDYLAVHQVELIECGDVGGGRDVDTPAQL